MLAESMSLALHNEVWLRLFISFYRLPLLSSFTILRMLVALLKNPSCVRHGVVRLMLPANIR